MLEAKAKPEFKARMTVRLAVAGAFHTEYMNSAVETLSEVLAKTDVLAPRIPVYSNVDAKSHSDPEVIKSILAMQVTSPVQWETTLGDLLEGKWKESSFIYTYEEIEASFLASSLKHILILCSILSLLGGLQSSYELGPGKVIAGIMKRVDRKHGVNSITV